MSGYKRATVTISEQEYRRLHQADMKRRFGGRKKAKTKETGTSPELLDALDQMEQRQQQLEQALREAGQQSDSVGADDLQAILAQNAEYHEQLAAMVEEGAFRGTAAVEQLAEAFRERMEQQREDSRRSFDTLAAELDSYEQQEQARGEAARQWLERAMLMASFIQEQFDHERFAPGKLSGVLNSLDFARSNLIQGNTQASLQSSQQVFLQLNELQRELEHRSLEWQTEYEQAYRTIREMIAELELNGRVSAFGLQGEELAEQVDVDYWTGGKHRQLLERCRQTLKVLMQERAEIPTEDLRRTHADWLPEMTRRLEAMIYEARLNALNSQLRMNIAEQALQALETQGFTLSESGYAENDMRSSFMAALENPDGSQVTIQVLPSDPAVQELSNELVVTTTHAELKTEQEVYLQWQELRRSLSESNLNVSQPEVRARPPVSISDEVYQPALLQRPVIRSGQ